MLVTLPLALMVVSTMASLPGGSCGFLDEIAIPVGRGLPVAWLLLPEFVEARLHALLKQVNHVHGHYRAQLSELALGDIEDNHRNRQGLRILLMRHAPVGGEQRIKV